jgi:L-amino acid N-acyltransferase YncA
MLRSGLLVRDSSGADIPAIAAIYARSVLEEIASFETIPPDEAEMARRRDERLSKGYPYFVAELDGRIAGYAYAGPFHTRRAYRWTVENTVYVDPAFQRRGVARALMERLIAECEQLGYRQMIAVIAAGDNADESASIRLHRALGFVDAGCNRAVGYKHGRWLNTWHLQLALGDGASTPPAAED